MKLVFKFLFFIFLSTTCVKADSGMPKDYYKLKGKAAKSYFFNFFAQKVENENLKILEERDFILSLKGKKDLDKNSLAYKRLHSLQKKYKVQNIYDYKTFLRRVDIVPISMAIAQAATESAWGKSRFIKVANNVFGHWTYNPRIGIIPSRREEGKRHLVRVFQTIQDSVSAYIRNLNRTGAYLEFRELRASMREKDQFIDGLKLSKKMDKYSGIGHDYVKILSQIIRKYQLTNYDKLFYKKTQGNKVWNLQPL